MAAWWDSDFGDDDSRPPILTDDMLYGLVFLLALLMLAFLAAWTL